TGGRRLRRACGVRGCRGALGSASDEGERIDLTAVAQDLEMDGRTGRAARGAHEGGPLAPPFRAARRAPGGGGWGASGPRALAVIDLDQLAVAGTLTRPGHHTRGDRGDARARCTGKVHTLMEGIAAVEGVGALTEVRGDESLGYRSPLGMNFLPQLAGEDDV